MRKVETLSTLKEICIPAGMITYISEVNVKKKTVQRPRCFVASLNFFMKPVKRRQLGTQQLLKKHINVTMVSKTLQIQLQRTINKQTLTAPIDVSLHICTMQYVPKASTDPILQHQVSSSLSSQLMYNHQLMYKCKQAHTCICRTHCQDL